MTEFRVRFEQEDGKGEIVNEKGVELTAREAVDCLNEQQARIEMLEKGILDYLFNNKSVGMLAEEMRLVE